MSNAPASIGRYEVLGSIGRGGMGSLFLALDPLLDRQIAVKLLREDDDELRERFAREARAAARLRHPNIVTIFDVGEHEGQPFIAMEYIQGQTLAEIVRGNVAFPLARKLELIESLCDGLGFAHRSGIVHRDIKPANLMLDADGSLKILDFGIARAAESSSMTQAGMLIGTLNYMSPEQVSGQTVDARSDLFAVGAVFYELIAYRQAFPGGLMAGVLNKILSGQPEPLTSVVPDLDPEVVGIIDRALQKEPDHRYQDLAAMRQDVSAARARLTLGGRSGEAYAPPPGEGTTPRATPSSSGRRAADLGELARRRTAQVKRHLEDAQGKLAAGEAEGAIAAAEQALLLDAGHGPAHDVIDKARAAIEARQLEAALEAAAGGLSGGDFAAASEQLARAAEIDPDAPKVVALRKSLNQAIEREEERRQREALEARVRETIDESDRQFSAGRHEDAIALLAAFTPTHPLVAQALERKRSEFDRIVEARRLEAEQAAKAEAEAKEREARLARERDERERAEEKRRQREKADRERREREKREQAERERREKAERAEREKREKAAREQAEREKREKAERAEREKREKAAREQAEREKRERAAMERAECEEADRRTRAAAAAAAATAPPDDATIVIPRDRPSPSAGAGSVSARDERPAPWTEAAALSEGAPVPSPQQVGPSVPATKPRTEARPSDPARLHQEAGPSGPAISNTIKIAGAAAAVVVVAVIAGFMLFGGTDDPTPSSEVTLVDDSGVVDAVPADGETPVEEGEGDIAALNPAEEDAAPADAPSTEAAPTTPTVTPAPPADPPPPSPGNTQQNARLGRLLADAQGLRAKGDRYAALEAIEDALAIDGDDERVTALARDMQGEARQRAQSARSTASGVGAAATGHVTFREGETLASQAADESSAIASARTFMAAEVRFNTAAAEGRKAPPSPPPTTAPPAETGPSPAEIRAAAEKEIRSVVERYRQAYNNLDADGVAAVFPSGPIAQLRDAWGGVQSQAVTFENLSIQLDGAGAAATVTAASNTVIRPRAGSEQRATAPMTLILRKTGNTWVITERR